MYSLVPSSTLWKGLSGLEESGDGILSSLHEIERSESDLVKD